MNIFLYQVPLQLLSIPTVPYVLPDAVRSASGETDIYLPPNLLGTPFFLISPTDTLGQARHLLSLSLQGRKLYRRCCDEVITVLGTGDAKKLKQVVDHAFRQSQKLLDRMPDYSHDPGILKFAYSSLLQPIVSIQSNFRKLWMMSEAGWSDASLQSMVALFLFQEADRRMEFLDRENGYWVDMTRYQLATQLIGWLFHHTDKQFFKDGYFMMRFSAKTEVKEGEADVGGVQYFSPVNIGDCLQWPPDPEKDEALKVSLDILGWRLWTRESADGMSAAVDFGPYAILQGYPVNLKVAKGEDEEASQMLGRMTALALFNDVTVLEQIRRVAEGESLMRGAALLIINRVPQLKPMVFFKTYGEFVEKAVEILNNEELNLGLLGRRESDRLKRERRLYDFLLGPVQATHFLREELFRRKPEWHKESGVDEQWQVWLRRVQDLAATAKK